MIVLSDVKEYLNIDFPDNDNYLSLLLAAARDRAFNITGSVLIESESFEIDSAILEDVATMYQNRGDINAGNPASIAVYRRYSARPMF